MSTNIDFKIVSALSVKITCDQINEVGSGTIVKDGDTFYVLTAAHCISKDNKTADAKSIIIESFWQKSTCRYQCDRIEKINTDDDKDYAILRIKAPGQDIIDYDNCLSVIRNYDENYQCVSYGFANGTNNSPRTYKLEQTAPQRWNVKENISERGEDLEVTLKGLSGAGVFVRYDDRLLLVGYVKAIITDSNKFDDIKVYSMSNFNLNWHDNWYDTIYDAIKEARPLEIKERIISNPINCDAKMNYSNLWCNINNGIRQKTDVSQYLLNFNDIKAAYPHPMMTSIQDSTVRHLFFKKNKWSDDEKTVFLLAIKDLGRWPSLYENLPVEAGGIEKNPLYAKLETRGQTLIDPFVEISDRETDDTIYEAALRAAFSLNFDLLFDIIQAWKPNGQYLTKRAVLMHLFNKDTSSHDALKDFIESEQNVENKYEAIQLYNYIDEKFEKEYSTIKYQNANIDSILSKIHTATNNIDITDFKIRPYGMRYTVFIGGQDYKSFPESLRAVQLLIETGLSTNIGSMPILSIERWYKICRHMLHLIPWPIIYYSLQYTNEDFLKRLGQDIVYRNDDNKIEFLPNLLTRILDILDHQYTPKTFFFGIYYLSSELYPAVDENIWYPIFREKILVYMCQLEGFEYVSYRDPIAYNVASALKCLKKKKNLQDAFCVLLSHINSNKSLVYYLVNDTMQIAPYFFDNGNTLAVKKTLLIDILAKDGYCIVYKLLKSGNLSPEELNAYNERLSSEGIDFARHNTTAIGMLFDLVQKESLIDILKQYLLENDIWYCGIKKDEGSFSLPQTYHMEMINPKIEWTEEEWQAIITNMRKNLELINLPKTKELSDLYFSNSYLQLLLQMRGFIERQSKTNGRNEDELLKIIESSIDEKRSYSEVYSGLCSDQFNAANEAANHLLSLIMSSSIEEYQDEISLLISIVSLRKNLIIHKCVYILDTLLDKFPEKMVGIYGKRLNIMLSNLVDYDYEQLDVRVTEFNNCLSSIAKTLFSKGYNNSIIRHWKDIQ